MTTQQPTNGIDSIAQGAGDDTLAIAYQSGIQATDFFDGGGGNNTISIGGTYSFTFDYIDLSNVQTDATHGFHNYGTIAFGSATDNAILTLSGDQIGAGLIPSDATIIGNPNAGRFTVQQVRIVNAHDVDISGWTITGAPVAIMIFDSTGNDHITGLGAINGRENVDLSSGGDDWFLGTPGRDIIDVGASLSSGDHIDGGGGRDDLIIAGDYTAGLVMTDTTFQNVSHIAMRAGHSYNLTFADGNVAAGQNFDIGSGNVDGLIFDGSLETDGHFTFHPTRGGTSDLTGGQLRDYFNEAQGATGTGRYTGGLGDDFFTLHGGHDSFIFTSIAESTGVAHDHITGFDGAVDSFVTPELVTGVDPLAGGQLRGGHFDADMTVALSSALQPSHALVWTPGAGNLAGHTFLVIDQDGTVGYQSGADIVVQIDGGVNLDRVTAASFS